MYQKRKNQKAKVGDFLLETDGMYSGSLFMIVRRGYDGLDLHCFNDELEEYSSEGIKCDEDGLVDLDNLRSELGTLGTLKVIDSKEAFERYQTRHEITGY